MKTAGGMKIGIKLGLGFATILLLMLGLGTFSGYEMGQVNAMSTEIATNWMPSIRYAEEMNSNTGDYRLKELQHILSSNASDKSKFEKAMNDVMATLKQNRDTYVKLISSPEEKALYEDFSRKFDAYMAIHDKVMSLSNAGKTVEATEMSRGESLKLYNDFSDVLLQIVKLNVKGGDDASTRADQIYAQAKTLIMGAIAFGILLGIAIAYLVTRSITRPLAEAVEGANRMAVGDFTVALEARSRDEVGQLMVAMQTMIGKLSQVIGEVRASADSLSSASEEVSATAQSLSQASSEQAAGVEETSASVEQMTSSIAQNTENAKVTDAIATKAAQEATEGGEAVKATVAAMNQIAKKIGIIDDIAYQTNLLALNAAIEAARAGEHGKGFAVVAAEVRKLAERSQVAAQEIGEVATNSVELAEKAGKLLDEMVPNIKRTSDLVQEITAASEEQSSGVGQINAAVGQLSQTTQQNASSSEELAATAEEMSGQAEQLQQTMSFFKLDTVGHAKIVRAQHKLANNAAYKKMAAGKVMTGSGTAHASEAALEEANFVKF